MAARVAYHLHRTQNRTTALTRAGITTDRSFASDLVQGRLSITENDARLIADRLALPFPELTRPLTPDEEEAWAFYRTSGRNQLAVWERARAAWLRVGLNDRAAAQAMGVSRAALSNILKGKSQAVMRLDQAAKLGLAFGQPSLPTLLVVGLDEPDQRR